ncbi:MAG: glycosyltransferase involved in cell wall biosynthesis, partial [Psychrobacter glaciei]|uniref:glycosyltransferase family 4 protein n=2 Tax=Psychrobacter glaciei TaxID=619771 RepID=UPI0039E4A893
VIAGSYSHLLHNCKDFKEDYLTEKIEDNFYFVWIKLPAYSNAHSKKRIINEFLFSKKIKKLINVIDHKPDVILHSSPALITYFGAVFLSEYYKVPYVFEVRDPWPLTLIELGGYSKNHPFIILLQWIEDKAYQKADYVLSNFFNAVEHMRTRGMNQEKFTWIPNGISLSELENKQPLSQECLNKVPSDRFIIGYTGTLGEANAMDYLIKSAHILKDKQDVHFVIVGSGKDKNKLVQQVELLKLTNVTFIDPIPKIQVQSMLDNFDACYIGWNYNSMYRLGIAANKIPEYMYSAKPVVHSFSGKGDFIQQAQSGITVEAENPQAIADAILEILALSASERKLIGQRGKAFVLENLTYQKLAKKLKLTLFSDEIL